MTPARRRRIAWLSALVLWAAFIVGEAAWFWRRHDPGWQILAYVVGDLLVGAWMFQPYRGWRSVFRKDVEA